MANNFKISNILALSMLATLAGCAPSGEALYARAEASMQKEDIRSALIDLKTLVQAEPQNAKARALLGDALVRSGQSPLGEIELEKARDLGAPAAMLLVPSCQILLNKGEQEQVLSDCGPDAVAGKAKVELQLMNGSALLNLNRAPEAKGHFESALASEPDNLSALLGLTSAVFAIDGAPAAIAVLDKATPAVKEQARYWLTVAGLRMSADDFAAAAKASQKALDKAEKNAQGDEKLMALGGLAEAQMRLGDVEAADATTAKLIRSAPDSALAKQLRGQVAAAGGKFDEARDLLEEVVSAQPQNYQAHTLLGIVYFKRGNVDQAEMHLSAVVANQPNDARAQRLLAEIRAQRGTPEESMAGLKTALKQTEDDPTMLATAGRLSLASGDREQALTYLAQAAAKTNAETTPETQIEIANGYLAAGELDRAIEVLEAMPAGGVADSQREYLLMLSLLRKGDTEKALSKAKTLVARSGNKPEVRNLVASVYSAAGKPDLAREQLVAAQKLAPDNIAVLTNLARLDVAQGKPAAAESSFKKILEKEPKNLVATLGMAAVAGGRKDTANAEKWLLKASADHPESPEAQVALAQHYVNANDFPKAKAVADKAVKSYPQSGALANARGADPVKHSRFARC